MIWSSLGLMTVGLIGTTALQAQSVIATYDISTANATTSATVTPTTASGVTAASLSASGVSVGSNLGGTYLWRVWGATTSLDPTKFMSWSVTPTAGNQIDFTGANATFALAFDWDSPAGLHGAETWELHGSTDNFAASNIPLGSPMSLGTALQQVQQSIPLGALATQTGTVTFRLYGYNDTKQSASADSAGLANRGAPLTGTGANLLINGTVSAVVPEPSSYAAVFGALAFGFVLITRRLRKA